MRKLNDWKTGKLKTCNKREKEGFLKVEREIKDYKNETVTKAD